MLRGGGGICLRMHATRDSSAPASFQPEIKFLRRLGPDPHANGAQTQALFKCPDLFELESGDFAVIGIDVTDRAKAELPPTASCGPDERIVWIPRKLLVQAKSEIPEEK